MAVSTLPLILSPPAIPAGLSNAGADSNYVSTHGGRQASGGLAPRAGQAAAGIPVLFDCGVRSEVDVIQALALGRLGGPSGWRRGSTDGVVRVLRELLAEAKLIMAVDGYRAPSKT